MLARSARWDFATIDVGAGNGAFPPCVANASFRLNRFLDPAVGAGRAPAE